MPVVIGGLYQHYKGNKYRVTGVAKHSETLQKLVVYQAQYGNKEMWVRPYDMFCEMVTVNGCEVPRFKYIGSELNSTCKILLEFPEDIKQAFFENGIDIEREIYREVESVTIEHEQVDSSTHKKDIATIVLAAGTSLALVILCVTRLLRVVCERPRMAVVTERDSEGHIIKEETILLEPHKTNQKTDIDFDVGTSSVSFKISDENKE